MKVGPRSETACAWTLFLLLLIDSVSIITLIVLGVSVFPPNPKLLYLVLFPWLGFLLIAHVTSLLIVGLLTRGEQSGKSLFTTRRVNTKRAEKHNRNERLPEMLLTSCDVVLKDSLHCDDGQQGSRHTDIKDSLRLMENMQPFESNSAPLSNYQVDPELYTYSALLEDEVRLLQVNKAEGEAEKLQINLVHLPLSLAQSKGYVSLSYTWGDAAASTLILVNNKSMKLRPNLVRILRSLATLHYTYIWIDAICTDQSNVTECSAQILRMRSIYAGAKEVIVATEAGASKYAGKIEQVLSIVEPSLSPENQAPQIMGMLKDDSFLSALEVLCNDVYWGRIWIIQEFAIGHDVKFLLNNNVIAASKLELLLRILERKLSMKQWKPALVIYDIRRSWQSNKPIQLLTMLLHTQNSLCKRRHDRVFGLLGLCPDALKYILEPNYELGVITMATSMTRAYIERFSLDIIFLAPYCKSDSTRPSWCVDFFGFDRDLPDTRALDMTMGKDQDIPQKGEPTRWNATGSVTADVSFRGNTLLTPAFLIGNIRSLGSARSDSANSGFPSHDQTWMKTATSSDICKWMEKSILRQNYKYNPGNNYFGCFGFQPLCNPLGYSFVRVFLPKHGTEDIEDPYNGLVKWICRNRGFFSGLQSLGDAAESLRHPFLKHGFQVFSRHYWYNDLYLWHFMDRMSKTDMRLMCLDDSHNFGIGWAATAARLHDKVFLIPGCSRPVILRPTMEGRYEVVGDAIVIGAMENEIWSKVKAEELEHIEIV